uniref:FLYWCH-type domain-containing protein n=1 Tax=Caenorhabditis tropicalis TaxID=1561998 RepID=A0A1I7SYY8_9PELO
MKSLAVLLLFIFLSSSLCTSEPEALIHEGKDFDYPLYGDEIGVKRLLYEVEGGYQFFYFCEKTKGENKKKCGSWVDKDGAKIKGATNKVTLKKDKAIISALGGKDRGRYTSIYEDPKKETFDTVVNVLVETRPPPPKN